MKFKKLVIRLSLLFFCLVLGYLAFQIKSEKSEDNSDGRLAEVKQFEVRGDSLAPLINPGQTIKLVYGYYDYQPVKREDIIAYNYAGNAVPIIKIIKAIPGDKWELKKNDQSDSYRIIVNGQSLKNSLGEFYQIPEAEIKMLKLYVRDYPIIPLNTYLILGNRTAGTLDATRFGLINKKDIIGKVEAGE